MNLLYAGTLPPHNGGSAILGSELLLGLSRMGHSVRAIAPITDETLLHGDTFAERHPEISVERFRLPYFENSPDLPASADYRRLEEEQMREILPRLIKKRRPDIILIGRETFALHVPDIAVYHSIPTALMIQGATTAGIIRKTVPEDIAQKLLANFHRTDLLIVVARHLAKTMEVLGFNNLKVIENTIDVEKFQPQQKNRSMMADLRISSEDIVVAHLSNLKPLKRPLDLLESAIPALKQNPRLLFLIVGDGLLRSKMEQFCRQNHLEERVRFTGWIEYNQVPLIMNLADITVMPSESEARALVYLEAQACGRVLIASDIAAARETVLDGETGFLFQTGNIPDLTRKLLSAAADSNLRAEIGRKAREAVLARPFSVLVNEYECAFRKLIRQYKSHGALV